MTSSGGAAAAVQQQRPSAALTPDEIEHYHRHGYVCARRILTEAELAPLDTAYAAQVAKFADRLYQQRRGAYEARPQLSQPLAPARPVAPVAVH